MVQAPAPLRAEVLSQAGQAWQLAGDPARAYAADGAALGLLPDDADLLTDRAEAAGSAGWFDKAGAHLDRGLKTNPARPHRPIYPAPGHPPPGRAAPRPPPIPHAPPPPPPSGPAR